MREQDLRVLSCGRSPAPTGDPGPCRRAYTDYVSTPIDVASTTELGTTLPKEFNPKSGLYVVDKPGYYLIDVRPVGGTAQTPDGTTHVGTWRAYEATSDTVTKWGTREFVYLVLETETNIEYVDVLREGGGLLRHLTKGTEISVQALDVPHAPARVCLRIEMAMRKRKCRASDDEEELDESDEGSSEVREGDGRQPQLKKKKGKQKEDGTSSEEEWEQGFSSDTDDERKEAERQQIRTITRAMRKQTVAEKNPPESENEKPQQQKLDTDKGQRGKGRGGRSRGARRGRGRGRDTAA